MSIRSRSALRSLAFLTVLAAAAPAAAQPEPSPPAPTTQPPEPGQPVDAPAGAQPAAPVQPPPTAEPAPGPPPEPGPPVPPPPSLELPRSVPPGSGSARLLARSADADPPRLRGGASLFYLGTPGLFRRSYIDWTAELSTELLFDERHAEAAQHVFTFGFVPRVALVDTVRHWLWVGTDLRVITPIGSDYSSDDLKPETSFGDLPLEVGYGYTILQRADGLVVRAGPRASVAWPRSSERDIGIDAKTRVRLDVDAQVPLAPGEAFNSVFVTAGASWRHFFSEATTPVGPGGRVSSFEYIEHDRVGLSIAGWLDLWGDLALGNQWGVAFPFYYSAADGGCFNVPNQGCVPYTATGARSQTTFFTTFDVSLSYPVARLVWVSAGYDNTASNLDSGGRTQSVFYSRSAEIYFEITVLLDAIYDRVRRPRSEPTP